MKKMQIKIYDFLPEDAKMIRRKVFMEEQGFQDEFDDIDNFALHMVLSEDDQPVATCRIYFSNDKNCYVIGRLAVYKGFRGKSYGREMIAAAENEIQRQHGMVIGLSAQKRVSEFYKRQGYQVIGEVYFDEGCPHIWMEKEIGN